MQVKVADFRDTISHLSRIQGVDYHSCANNGERALWLERAKRFFNEYSALECKRATDYDRAHMTNLLDALKNRIETTTINLA